MNTGTESEQLHWTPLHGFNSVYQALPRRGAELSVPRCLCVREMLTAPTPGGRGRWFAESALQTHLPLLGALQALLNLPEPTQSKWVMAEGGWRLREGPACAFTGAVCYANSSWEQEHFCE